MLSGPTSFDDGSTCHTNIVTTHALLVDTQFDQRLQSFWDLESRGICNHEKTVYDEFSESVTFGEGRCQVSLPWKQQHKPLPDNYQLSLRRLTGLMKRLKQTPDLLHKINTTQPSKSKSGRGLWKTDDDGATRVHYLPHHAVIRTDKSTTKLRIV